VEIRGGSAHIPAGFPGCHPGKTYGFQPLCRVGIILIPESWARRSRLQNAAAVVFFFFFFFPSLLVSALSFVARCCLGMELRDTRMAWRHVPLSGNQFMFVFDSCEGVLVIPGCAKPCTYGVYRQGHVYRYVSVGYVCN
jgi:hypothetical protein